MDPLDGVVVKCFPSATIAKLSRLLSTDVNLHNFEYIIIHVGTNNIGNRDSFGNILSDYGNLIASVKKLKSSIRIIVSAILPRPVDHDNTDSMIKAVNMELRTKSLIKHCLYTTLEPKGHLLCKKTTSESCEF